MVRLVSRWLGRRRWVLIGDGSYSCVELGWECLSAQATLITRLRLDARLFGWPAPVPAGRRGRKPQKGAALAKLATRSDDALTQGEEVTVQWGRVVLLALVAGGDLRGNPSPPRRGDPAPVVRPGHRPHHPPAAGALFAGLSDGPSLAGSVAAAGALHRLVAQAARDLLRLPRAGVPHRLRRVEFRQLNRKPGRPGNFPSGLGTLAGSVGLDALKWPKPRHEQLLRIALSQYEQPRHGRPPSTFFSHSSPRLKFSSQAW